MSKAADGLYDEFIIETNDLLDYAEAELLNAEKAESDQFYDSVFRALHSIKGGAGMLGLLLLQEHMHKLENQWIPLKENKKLSKNESDYFLSGVDAARKILHGENVHFDYSGPVDSSLKKHNANVENQSSTHTNAINRILNKSSQGLIYVVDDEPDILEIVKSILTEENFEIHCFESADLLFEAINSKAPDVVITDFKMPTKNGLDVLSEVRRVIPDVPVIILTGHITKEILITSLRDGGFYSAIEKPFKNINLIQDSLSACRFHEAKKMVKRSLNLLVYQFSDLEKYLISQGQHDVAKTIGNELKILLKKQKDLTHWKTNSYEQS